MKIVKKAKKTQSLLSLHLSYIPMEDPLVSYILKKLEARDQRSQIESNHLYHKMNESLDWKEKYELVKRIKI